MKLIKINNLKELMKIELLELKEYDCIKILLLVEILNEKNINKLIEIIKYKNYIDFFISFESNETLNKDQINLIINSFENQKNLKKFEIFFSDCSLFESENLLNLNKILKKLNNIELLSVGLLSTNIDDNSFKQFYSLFNEKDYFPNIKEVFIGITKTGISKELFEEFKKFILNQTKIETLNLKMFWLKNISMQELAIFSKNEAKNHKNKNLIINMGKIMQAN